MTKQGFIALADAVREHNRIAFSRAGDNMSVFHADQIEALADFCWQQNPAFKRERWLNYIAGECGKNGGTIK